MYRPPPCHKRKVKGGVVCAMYTGFIPGETTGLRPITASSGFPITMMKLKKPNELIDLHVAVVIQNQELVGNMHMANVETFGIKGSCIRLADNAVANSRKRVVRVSICDYASNLLVDSTERTLQTVL
jgi:hypothetical protein